MFAAALEYIVIVRGFGISADVAVFGSKPQIWIARFLQPLTVLSILTLVLWRNGETWHSLGLRKPPTWSGLAVQVIVALAVVFGSIYLVRNLIVDPLRLRYFTMSDVRDVTTLIPALFYRVAAGFYEELVFRGFIPSRLAKIFGGGTVAWQGAVVLSAVLFGFLHFALGPASMVLTFFGGILLGELYLLAGRNLWIVVIVHSVVGLEALILTFVYR